MKKNKVVIMGYARHGQTAAKIKQLQHLGMDVIVIEPYGQQGCIDALSWQPHQIHWQDQDISVDKLCGVFADALAPDYPYLQSFEQSPDQRLSWDDWYQCFGQQRDRSDTLLSLLLHYEQCGISMINPVSKSHLSRRKPFQIAMMNAAGCQMPATLVSNDPVQAEQFIRAHGDCIIKPAAGGSLTLAANELLATGQLDQLRQAPAIIQQRIYGTDLRVIVIDDKVCSVASIDVPENTIDFRGDPDYEQGRASYSNVRLPEAIAAQCVAAVRKLGLRYSGIDIKQTPDNQYYFLECNSGPMYLDIEHKLQHTITEALCLALLP